MKKSIKKKTPAITKDSIISEVVLAHPETITVFLKYGLHCVGCSMAQFDTIASGARSHGVNPEYIIKDIKEVVAGARRMSRKK